MSDPETERPSASSDRKSEEDDVASHVSGENLAERQNSYRDHQTGHNCHA
jgi:hypothetical protein